MQRFLVVALIFGLTIGVFMSPASGQGDSGRGAVDKGSNGQPAKGKVDEEAAAELKRAWALFEEDGKIDDSIGIALLLLGTFEDNEDYHNLVDCEFLIGQGYYHKGEWANAIRYMKGAWEDGTTYFDDEMNSYPLKVIGECQYQLGQTTDAIQTFRERVQRLEKTGDINDLPVALFDLGTTLIGVDKVEDGLKYLMQAQEANNTLAAQQTKPDSGATTEERIDTTLNHAEITYYIAVGHSQLGNNTQCKANLEQAYSFFKGIQDSKAADVTDRLVAVLDDLVWVNEELGDQAAADKYRAERDKLNQ